MLTQKRNNMKEALKLILEAMVYQHNRETLDDLIADLIQYRNTLPTADEYMESGRL